MFFEVLPFPGLEVKPRVGKGTNLGQQSLNERMELIHVEAEPPPGKVKADISACPSRAVVRYHSIFISTIVRVPAGV